MRSHPQFHILTHDAAESDNLCERALEEEIRQCVREGGIRVIGPNNLRLMNPVLGLNVAFADMLALRGSVGFISQSGAIGRPVLNWSHETKTSFSKFVSFGGMIDVQWNCTVSAKTE